MRPSRAFDETALELYVVTLAELRDSLYITGAIAVKWREMAEPDALRSQDVPQRESGLLRGRRVDVFTGGLMDHSTGCHGPRQHRLDVLTPGRGSGPAEHTEPGMNICRAASYGLS